MLCNHSGLFFHTFKRRNVTVQHWGSLGHSYTSFVLNEGRLIKVGKRWLRQETLHQVCPRFFWEVSIPGRLVTHPSKVTPAIIQDFGSSGCTSLAPPRLSTEVIPNNILNYSDDWDGARIPREGKAHGETWMPWKCSEIRKAESLKGRNPQTQMLNIMRMRMLEK